MDNHPETKHQIECALELLKKVRDQADIEVILTSFDN